MADPTPKPKPKTGSAASDPEEEQESVEEQAERAVAKSEIETLSEAGEEAAENAPDDPFSGTDSDDIDVDLAEIDVGEESEDTGSTSAGGDPFSDVDSGGSSGETAAPDAGMAGGMGDMAEMGADTPLDQIINEGAARFAVVGLPDDGEKDELETEFKEVAEAFRLGMFGEQVLSEYVFVDDDVDPVWGLTGSLFLFGAIVLHRRPDGDEVVSNASESLKRFTENLK